MGMVCPQPLLEGQSIVVGIEGKAVVITGASSGIGEATALLLAERGATVVLGARGLDRLWGVGRPGGATARGGTERSTVSSITLASCPFPPLTTCVSKTGRR